SDPRGVYFAERPSLAGSRVAFLFPGQGAQSPGMVADLAIAFPEVREAFEAFDAALRSRGRAPVGPRGFPPPAFTEGERAAVGAASVGLLRLLKGLGLEAELAAGHSYGELVALHAAGCLSAEDLAALSEARGRLILEAVGGAEPGTMAALSVGPDGLGDLLD